MKVKITCAGGCNETHLLSKDQFQKHDYYLCNKTSCKSFMRKKIYFGRYSVKDILEIHYPNAANNLTGIDYVTTNNNSITSYGICREQPLYNEDNRLIFIPREIKPTLTTKSNSEIVEYLENPLSSMSPLEDDWENINPF